MGMLYIYAITDATAAPDLTGIDGEPVQTIGAGAVYAVASEHDDLRLRADEDTLWAHESVVEAMMEAGTVLPLRMGSTMEGSDSVDALLRARRADFARAMDRVRGAVEIGVRGLVAAGRARAGSPSGGPGAEYMRDQLERKRRVDAVAARMRDGLVPLVRDATAIKSSHDRMSLRAAYLVESDRVDEFIDAVERIEHQAVGATLICTGPWPPFSFASGVN
jgi:hypothetical protein